MSPIVVYVGSHKTEAFYGLSALVFLDDVQKQMQGNFILRKHILDALEVNSPFLFVTSTGQKMATSAIVKGLSKAFQESVGQGTRVSNMVI